MFGSNGNWNRNYNRNGGGGRGGSIVQSGWSIEDSVGNLSKMRDDFASCLELDPDNISVEGVYAAAEMEGEYRGYNEIYKRQSKQQLNAARAVKKQYDAEFQHINQAAQLENQWQQSTARNLQKLSGTLIDLGVTQRQHDGFSAYLDEADRMIQY